MWRCSSPILLVPFLGRVLKPRVEAATLKGVPKLLILNFKVAINPGRVPAFLKLWFVVALMPYGSGPHPPNTTMA